MCINYALCISVFFLGLLLFFFLFRFHGCFALGNGFPSTNFFFFLFVDIFFTYTMCICKVYMLEWPKKYISIGHLGRNVRCGALCEKKIIFIFGHCVLLRCCMAVSGVIVVILLYFFYTSFVRCIWHAWMMVVFNILVKIICRDERRAT